MAGKDRPMETGTNDGTGTAGTRPAREPAQEPRRDPPRERARPDPKTGEVPAGPGDAGRQDRPEVNRGSPGDRQMSNRRLGTGLGLAAALAVLAVVVALLA